MDIKKWDDREDFEHTITEKLKGFLENEMQTLDKQVVYYVGIPAVAPQ